MTVGLTILVLTLAIHLPAQLYAQAEGDTLILEAALALARDANPMLQAARLRADAASEAISRAGALPDPQLAVGLRNRPLGGFGTDERMTMNVLQLNQTLPWPGKLGFAKQRARHLAQAHELDAAEAERQLLARVTSAYYRLAYIDRAIRIMESTRELLRGFHDVSSTMYTVGTGLQQDVLQAQIAIAQMTENITVMVQHRAAVEARLNALLGRDATVPVPELELPLPSGELPSADSLMVLAVARRPALQAARARIEAAQAGYRAARRSLYPNFMVTLGYGQRPQFDDMLTMMVGISIPVWAGAKQLPLRREMLAMQAMEEAKEQDVYNETFARITELRADAARARNLSALYRNAVLPQARAAVESALSAYRVGKVDYMTLVQNEMTVNRYAIETVRLASDYHRIVGELEALVGADRGGSR